jgi:hypothetical protein
MSELVNIQEDKQAYALSVTSESEEPSPRVVDNQITFGNTSRVTTDENNTTTSEIKQEEKIIVYGNDLKIQKPSKMGNCFTYWYINGQPRIVIGPQCTI